MPLETEVKMDISKPKHQFRISHDTPFSRFLEKENRDTINSYDAKNSLIREHYGLEITVLSGGYGYRQIFELIQNGADAILEAHENDTSFSNADAERIEVVLKKDYLYVANTGAPISEEGLQSLLMSHSSPKRGNQIGRFGLGFKSLLGLSERIDLFSRTNGSIQFDPLRCQEQLRKKFNVTETPRLRLAWALPSDDDTSLDKFHWAETLVRVAINDDTYGKLKAELHNFRSEFLLFFPVSASLVLRDEESQRCLSVKRKNNDRMILKDGDVEEEWFVVSREEPMKNPQALADRPLYGRDINPISWAFPIQSKHSAESGRFWMFFPTNTQSAIAGIVNAPWKLNSDRNGVIPGAWSDELMRQTARLIADNISRLYNDEDPGSLLDAFPRRIDSKDEIAVPLVEELWKRLETEKVLADCNGTLRQAKELQRHPESVNVELVESWLNLATSETKAKLVHPSCFCTRDRESRLNSLFDRLKQDRIFIRDWFGQIASAEPEKAIEVLRLAEGCQNLPRWMTFCGTLAIIPIEGGQLVTASEAILAHERLGDRHPIDHRLLQMEGAAKILTNVLGVQTQGADAWKEMLGTSLKKAIEKNSWKEFWGNLRMAPSDISQPFLEQSKTKGIKVKRRDGEWVQKYQVLLPGKWVEEGDHVNEHLLIDNNEHVADLSLLKSLDVSDAPMNLVYELNEGVGEYLNSLKNRDYEKFQHNEEWHIREGYNSMSRQRALPDGYALLMKLSGIGNAKATRDFMTFFRKEEVPIQIQMKKYKSEGDRRRKENVTIFHPLFWLLWEYGTLHLGDNSFIDLITLSALGEKRESMFKKFVKESIPIYINWKEIIAECSVSELESKQYCDLWEGIFQTIATPENIRSGELEEFWIVSADDDFIPDSFQFAGDVGIEDVYVTSSKHLVELAKKWLPNNYVFLLPQQVLQRWIEHGASNLENDVEVIQSEPRNESVDIRTPFPDIAAVLTDTAQTFPCRGVNGLKLRFGTEEPRETPCLFWKGELLWVLDTLEELSRKKKYEVLLQEMIGEGWVNGSISDCLLQIVDTTVEKKRAEVAKIGSLPEKLLKLVGGKEASLRKALGDVGQAEFTKNCPPFILAKLVLDQLGSNALKILVEALENEGFRPPKRWNTEESLNFVAAIGFPEKYGTSEDTKREVEEFISGPIPLNKLHDFQEEVKTGLTKLWDSNFNQRRAVVSLPTGGGKTRVTVQTAVELVLKSEKPNRSVLWIAQTDELCEQAVQAFRQVWHNYGAERTELRIIRLWGMGGRKTPASSSDNMPVVTVASIQTLNYRVGKEEMDWLKNQGMLVIDECHHGITKSYTGLLRWLDVLPAPTSKQTTKEPMVIGLSATPFRVNEDESERLAKRFGKQWFPSNQESLHQQLLDQGVLAKIESAPLSSAVALSPHLLGELEKVTKTGDALREANVLEQIDLFYAANEQRNKLIVQTIQHAKESSILLFANSLKHAHELSARLNLLGIKAAPVDGNTPINVRRDFLKRFQQQEIRVLCNYNVLSTGFDAPKADMILISRIIFSPVRYMQIVGRGLRGVANGGTEKCRLVTVIDNLKQFEHKLAYHFCKQYYE